MKTYETIYAFQVDEKVIEGESVYGIDRLSKTVLFVNDMPYGDVISIIKNSDKDRYLFWIVKD